MVDSVICLTPFMFCCCGPVESRAGGPDRGSSELDPSDKFSKSPGSDSKSYSNTSEKEEFPRSRHDSSFLKT